MRGEWQARGSPVDTATSHSAFCNALHGTRSIHPARLAIARLQLRRDLRRGLGLVLGQVLDDGRDLSLPRRTRCRRGASTKTMWHSKLCHALHLVKALSTLFDRSPRATLRSRLSASLRPTFPRNVQGWPLTQCLGARRGPRARVLRATIRGRNHSIEGLWRRGAVCIGAPHPRASNVKRARVREVSASGLAIPARAPPRARHGCNSRGREASVRGLYMSARMQMRAH